MPAKHIDAPVHRIGPTPRTSEQILAYERQRAEEESKALRKTKEPMTNSIATEIRNAIVDATVTDTGEEVVDVSACYVALAQDLQGTLPDHVTVAWGPCATAHKKAVDQAPAWVWEAALEGKLVLTDGRVALA